MLASIPETVKMTIKGCITTCLFIPNASVFVSISEAFQMPI
jgi:hypothetical protein